MNPMRFLFGLAAAGIGSSAIAQSPIGLSIPNGPGVIPQVTAPLPPSPQPVGIAPKPVLPTQNTLASVLGLPNDLQEYRQRAAIPTPAGEMMAPAEERMKAVSSLGAVDYHSWPEAEVALIGALRADRNECIRMKAATVLGSGCWCTKKTIMALSLAASGSDCDGYPTEKSPRVRGVAQNSLHHCLACYREAESVYPDRKDTNKKSGLMLPPLDPAPPARDPEKGSSSGGSAGTTSISRPPVEPVSYYQQVDKQPTAEIFANARRSLALQIPLDLEAAGMVVTDNARILSPRPTSLLSIFSGSEPVPSAAVIAPDRSAGFVFSTSNVNAVHSAPVGSVVAVATPTEKSPPFGASSNIASSLLETANRSTVTRTAAPTMIVPPQPVVAMMTSSPQPVTAPRTTARTMPILPPQPVVAATMMVPPPAASAMIIAPPTPVVPRTTPTPPQPAPLPVALSGVPRPTTTSSESPAARVTRMLHTLVPIEDLVRTIDQLGAEDLQSAPGAVHELIAGGVKCSQTQVRLAAVKALVRCKVSTSEAVSALTDIAETDPVPAVRAAAKPGDFKSGDW